MRNLILRALVVSALSSTSQVALAQQTTERFIPVGQSPGVSNVQSYIGEIQSVDMSARTMTCTGAAGSMTIRMTDSTDIWLDRSGMRESNTVGSPADLAVGGRVEVKYRDPETREEAEWIKLVVTAGE